MQSHEDIIDMRIKQFLKKIPIKFDMSKLKYTVDRTIMDPWVYLKDQTEVKKNVIYFHFYNQNDGNFMCYSYDLNKDNSAKMEKAVGIELSSVIVYIFENEVTE